MAALYLIILITCLIQLVYYAMIFNRVLRLPESPANVTNEPRKPVSVVICARNEADNLEKILPVILDQYYPADFEVIVIDDASTDHTQRVLAEYEMDNEHLYIFRIEPGQKRHSGKKQALQLGVSLAQYDWIAVTDADCCPVSSLWLYHMTGGLYRGNDVVLGVSPYYTADGPFNGFFRTEAMLIAMQYTGFTMAGMPFMGVGRNMAYRRQIFEEHDMTQHWDLASGDDDLFINDVSGRASVDICPYLQARTYSEAPLDLKKWFRQKLRHYSAGHRYNLMQKLWLGYYWVSSLALYALLPVTVVMMLLGFTLNPLVVAALLLTALFRWIMTGLIMRRFGLLEISWSVPIFDFAYILSVWVLSPISGLGRKRWN